MSPQFVAEFWGKVQTSLTKKCGLTASNAKKCVRQYRKELARLGVGETVYNRGVEKAVESAARLIDQGAARAMTA